METLLGKTEVKSTGPQEQELSPEMRDRFNSLMLEANENYWVFGGQVNWKEFQEKWIGQPPMSKKSALEARRTWLEMKKEGNNFEKFIINKIWEKLDEN